MAYFDVLTIETDAIRFEIGGLENAARDYDDFGITVYYGAGAYVKTDYWTSASVGTRVTYWVENLRPDTSYYFEASAKYNGRRYDIGSRSARTLADAVLPPSAPSWSEITGTTTTTISVSWGRVSDAEEYEIYVDGYYYDYTTSTSMTIRNLQADTYYIIEIYSWSRAGGQSTNRNRTGAYTLPNPPPTPTLSLNSKTATSANIRMASSGADRFVLQYKLSTTSTWTTWSTYAYNPTNVTGLISGRTYHFRAYAVKGTQESNYSSTLTVSIGDPVPATPTGLQTTNVTTNTIAFKWNAVTYATVYYWYIDDIYQGSVTGTSVSQAWYDPGKTYKIGVEAANDSGASSRVSITVNTPTLSPTITLNSKTETSAIIGLSSSGATSYSLEYKLSTTSTWSTWSGIYNPMTVTGLISGRTYNFRARAIRLGVYSSYSSTLTVDINKARPDNWEWEYTIASGGTFYTQSGKVSYLMRAIHWNNFTARINGFRDYKGLSAYTFTSVSANTTVTRVIINQAINAINSMLTTGNQMSTIPVNGTVTAKVFTDMVSRIKLIT